MEKYYAVRVRGKDSQPLPKRQAALLAEQIRNQDGRLKIEMLQVQLSAEQEKLVQLQELETLYETLSWRFGPTPQEVLNRKNRLQAAYNRLMGSVTVNDLYDNVYHTENA